mmetsp:Transcript_14014/g.38365  ORF Transcript_14014/g.38365 Transcript_14014/m.38365 type:complete len:410 (-) Transcript_14014:194-1423(-)
MMAALGGMTTAHRVGAARSCVRDRAGSHVRACARPSAGFGRNARPLVLCQARPSKPQKVGSSPSPGGVAPKHLNQASAVADPRQARSIDEGDPYVGPRNRAAEPRAEDIAEPTRKPKRLTKGEREEIGEKYEWSAWVSTCGVISIAITATYFRLLREVSDGGAFPSSELFAQLALIAGAAVGMEFYARYAHKYLWHDSLWSMSMKDRKEWNRPIWLLHESHHLPREGAFEANDIFAIANGVPAFALCAYGFLTPGVFGGLCFGAGLGITLFGIAYMYVHDGLVHKRFPTGPLGKLPLLRKIAAGHTIHHTEAFDGVPWGLFLGIQELEQVPGGIAELEAVMEASDRKMRREEEEEAARVAACEGGDVEACEEVGFATILQPGEHIPSQAVAPACKLPEDALGTAVEQSR